MIQEEDDKIQFESKEIKFTEHMYEFRNICSKVNKDRSAELFLKLNNDFSLWNLKDRNKNIYFLSRAASKEARDFIENEIKEREAKEEEFYYKKAPEKVKLDNLEPSESSETDSSDYELLEEEKKKLELDEHLLKTFSS
mmetsp:Transcript_14496/g.14109  ORF Transcript_14496/g.14109 Transcript_14496/m.14109 type:complete len:139 (-) Transcript_14496:901-1317(-)